VYYSINQDVPIFHELRGLLLKTVALRDVILEVLNPLSKNIQYAFIYGSEAKGTATFTSDIDLIIVGDVDEVSLHKQIMLAEKNLSRINQLLNL
jgi:uncharacterized protein